MSRALPVAAAFGHAVSSVTDNLRIAFTISWPWYALVMPISVAVYAFLAVETDGNPESRPGLTFFITLLLAALALVSASSIAVNWHRYILRDELPRGSEVLRLDNHVWRYFGNMLLIMISVVAVLIFIGIPLSILSVFSGVPGVGAVMVLILGVPVAGTMFLRLAVKLPAIALGRTDFSFRDAWQVSEGNNVAVFILFALNLLIAVGAIVGVVAIHALFSLFGALVSAVVEIAVQVIANWILTIFGITILTSLYGFFVENRDF